MSLDTSMRVYTYCAVTFPKLELYSGILNCNFGERRVELKESPFPLMDFGKCNLCDAKCPFLHTASLHTNFPFQNGSQLLPFWSPWSALDSGHRRPSIVLIQKLHACMAWETALDKALGIPHCCQFIRNEPQQIGRFMQISLHNIFTEIFLSLFSSNMIFIWSSVPAGGLI